MIPAQFLLNEVQTLLGSDTATLAPAAGGVKVHLAMAAFTPGLGLTLGGLTEATFTGYAALVAAVGAQLMYHDTVTGNLIVELKPPVGGWSWKATGATGLPMTIYGFYCTDNATTQLYGSGLLPAPIVLAASGDGLDIGKVTFGIQSIAIV